MIVSNLKKKKVDIISDFMETRQWILDQTTAHAQRMTAQLYLLGELSSFQTLDLKKYLIQLIVSNTHV